MNWSNDSCKEGSESELLNSVFGNNEDVVCEVKLRRFSALEFLGFEIGGFSDSFRAKNGVG